MLKMASDSTGIWRFRAEALLAAKAEFSVRLRTYIRFCGIGTSNNANIGWENMAEECEQANSISDDRVSEVCSTVQAYMDRITQVVEQADLTISASKCILRLR